MKLKQTIRLDLYYPMTLVQIPRSLIEQPPLQHQPRSGTMAGTPLCRYLLFVQDEKICAFIPLVSLPCPPSERMNHLGLGDGAFCFHSRSMGSKWRMWLDGFREPHSHMACQEGNPPKKLIGSPGDERELPLCTQEPGKFATDPKMLRQAPANEERWRVSKQHRAEL